MLVMLVEKALSVFHVVNLCLLLHPDLIPETLISVQVLLITP